MSVSVEHKEAPFQSQTQHKLEDIMVVQDLKMHFPVTAGLLKRQVGAVKAVDGVSFSIKRGQTLGIVGESGSGKSTVGNCLLQRYKITSGDIFFEGHNLKDVTKHALRSMRKQMQMITQDPFASLDPRMDIQGAISEGMRIHHMGTAKEREETVVRMMEMVGLNPQFRHRFPHEFSGGQRQRISIARALALQPTFIVCDEVVSALDVSIQAQVITLLMTPASGAGADLCLHRPRPVGGPAYLQSGGGDVPGQDHGADRFRRALRPAASPLYPGADLRRSHPQS